MTKELNRIETTYGNGTYWIVYSDGERRGYELVDKSDSKFSPCKNKILLENVPMYHLLKEVETSDNEMLYIDKIDYYEEEDFFDMLDLVEESIKKFPVLGEFVEIKDEEIIIEGQIITKVLF